VLFIHGYSDAGVPNPFGRGFREMGHPVSWARLIAASGLVAILYSNRQAVDDAQAILAHIRDEAPGLGIDGSRICLFASSGHVPLALWLLMQADRHEIRCAVLCCGYMLDLYGATSVADMQKLFPFANPGAGKTMDDVRNDVPMLVVRAGRDQFGVNTSLDSFIAGALQKDLPVRMINHAGAPHAFDLFEDSEATREIIREILGFMQVHLSGPAKAGHYTGPEGGHYTALKADTTPAVKPDTTPAMKPDISPGATNDTTAGAIQTNRDRGGLGPTQPPRNLSLDGGEEVDRRSRFCRVVESTGLARSAR
jgi:dienelactone hydrolase